MRKIVQIPILFSAAKEMGFNELRRESIYCLFPHLRSLGFFRLGGYMYTYYGGLYSGPFQDDIDELITIHLLEWKVIGAPCEIYSLSKDGENYAKKVLSDPDLRVKILGTRSFDYLKKKVGELLSLPYDDLEKKTYELLKTREFFS